MTETRNATKNFSQLMISKKSKEAFAEAARVSEALKKAKPFETTVSPLAAEFC